MHCSISVLKREILSHCSLYHVAASFCSCSVVSSNDVGIIVATGYQIDLVNLFCCFRVNIDARHIQESVFTVGYKGGFPVLARSSSQLAGSDA